MAKLLYKPVNIVAGIVAGAVARALYRRIWRLASGQDDAPKATQEDRHWGEVLLAAGLQGTVFALVRAAVDRGAAVGTRRLTGWWPGEPTSDSPAVQDR
jgi:hypothetical protein